MPSRRGGRKSHHGCQNCKARHLKCDEDFPTCGRCKKRNETCVRSYTTFRSAPTTPTTSQHISTATTEQAWQNMITYQPRVQQASSTTVAQSSRDDTPTTERSRASPRVLPDICDRLVDSPGPGVESTPQGDWLDDMLLQHYLAVVSWTLNEDRRVVLAYRQLVPELAVKHASLKHAVLTISAAHCVATLSPPAQPTSPRVIKALVERSLFHHTCTLNLFAKQVSDSQISNTMSHDDCIAMTLSSIFVLTSFITQLHAAFQEFTPATPGAIDKTVAMLNLLGPITTFFQQYHEQIAASQLRVFLEDYLPQVEEGIAPVPPEAEHGLEAVAALCDNSSFPRHREVYVAAVKGLRQTYRNVALNPAAVGARFGWIIGDDALAMANFVYKRLPEALILLAYWAACLIPWPHWWATDFAANVIREVDQSLPPEYSRYLDWPRSRLAHE